MSTQSIYSYVDAMNFPGRASANDADGGSVAIPLLPRSVGGGLSDCADHSEFDMRPPFHPVKFLCFLYQAWPAEVRIEGEFWVDNAPDVRCEMLIARSRAWYRVAGLWLAASGQGRAGLDWSGFSVTWDDVYGDRRQRLHIYGAGAQAVAIRRQLDGCLIHHGSEFLRRAARPHVDSLTKEIKNVI